MKKSNAGPTSKSGAGKNSFSISKSPSSKITTTSSPSKVPSKLTSATTHQPPKKPTIVSPPSTSNKVNTPVSYASPTKTKSTTFGIIWLPRKKTNKKKELYYNSHRNERYKERAPSMYNFMSGDSHHSEKKEEDSEKHLLVPDRLPLAVAGASAASAVVESAVITTQPEKEELINPSNDKESKELSPELNKNETESSGYLEHNDSMDKSIDSKWDRDRGDKGDKVDSVYLRPPPPHKARSNTSTPAEEQEDCGIKCLYYTLQCCDCVLM